MYEERLSELGLTDNEVRIYLLLLKQGMMNPSKISQKLGFHRGYVYDALERMQEKEVVNSILKDNKKHFQATSPENLVEILRFKLEGLEKILPFLTKIKAVPQEQTKVELYKGKRVYQTLLKDMITTLKKESTAYLTGIDEDILLKDAAPVYLRQYVHMMKSRKIKEKLIIKKGGRKIKHPNVEYKELDAGYIGNTMQIIYGNKIALFIVGEPYYLIVIENKEVAETYKKQFSLLWNTAK